MWWILHADNLVEDVGAADDDDSDYENILIELMPPGKKETKG